ncbi:hypothetical protein MCERE1_00819 [Burkholderiaceae bacterium]
MPKLDGTHLPQRLAERLADLKADKEVAARDIKALLTDKQIAEMEAAWAEQQALRKVKRARTKEEEQELGWKTKREIYIEAYEKAFNEASDGVLEELERLQLEATKRQMRIYFETLNEALKEGKEKRVAENLANNALTRAGLRRMDGQKVGTEGLSRRDREIREMEDAILKKAVSEMDEYEREQYELSQEYEKALREKGSKLGR